MKNLDNDPKLDGSIRVARPRSRDGIQELGQAFVLGAGAVLSCLKIVDPLLPAWVCFAVAASIFLLSFAVRKWSDRIRMRITPGRTGYAGLGKFSPKVLLSIVALSLAIALLVLWGILSAGIIVPMIALYFGGTQILKSTYTSVRRTGILAGISIFLSFVVTAFGGAVLDRIFAWSVLSAALYLAVGLWVLFTYLRLPKAEVTVGAGLD